MSIVVQDLCFSYGSRNILKNISFTVEQGELISVLGPNGVGKSTLFQCMLGILSSFTGIIKINNQNVASMHARALSKYIAYIPQSHYPAFNYSVLDMVLMGTTAQLSPFASPGKSQVAIAMKALERIGIDHFAQRDYMHISGGERQLVLIARALAQQSRILIMDEPTANLDYGNQIRVLTQIKSLSQEGYTVIQSTHNPEQSYMFSKRIIAMLDGKLIAHGAPKDVLTSNMIQTLYGIDTNVESLYGDMIRVCIPQEMVGKRC